MDEFQLCSLIAEGENEVLEFKREVHLQSQEEKAEFVKDLVALANSAPEVGHMLIGLDDDGLIVGADQPDEERMQQIIDTYASPPIRLQCEMVPVQHPTFPSVAVIRIRATRKPSVLTCVRQLRQGI